MKTKTFEIEVIRTSRVKVTLPITMSEDTFIDEWERGLWGLDDREASIAEYAARMAVEFPDSHHDGIGRLITRSWQKPDYSANEHQVVAIVTEDDTEAEVISQEDWKEAQP
mgnify:CR=1 FL=1